jgi:hypothetical protein
MPDTPAERSSSLAGALMRSPTSQPAHTSRAVLLATSLDPVTHARVTELAAAFQCRRPRLLRYLLQWGVAHGSQWPLTHDRPPGPAQNLSVQVAAGLRQQVHAAASAAGVSISMWLRHIVQHVTPPDFPASWQPGAPPKARWEDLTRVTHPSHDSRTYTWRFILRVDEDTGRKLDRFMQTFERPAAEIIRHLIARATLADFPASWPPAVEADHQERDA